MKEKSSKEELGVMLDEGIKILTALKDFAKALLSTIDVTLTSTGKIRGVISEDKKIEPKENQTLEVYSKEDVRGLLAKKTMQNNGAYKEDVKALVKKFSNGGSFKDIDEKDYAALLSELEEVGNE